VQKNRQDFEMELKKTVIWKNICLKGEKGRIGSLL